MTMARQHAMARRNSFLYTGHAATPSDAVARLHEAADERVHFAEDSHTV